MFRGKNLRVAFSRLFVLTIITFIALNIAFSLFNMVKAETAEKGGMTEAQKATFEARRLQGVLAGLAVVLGFIFLIWMMCEFSFMKRWPKERRDNWRKHVGIIQRFFRAPLHFTITPLGRYSISLAQILWWTLILLFTSVFIWVTRGEQVIITQQILILLGISGATALGSKINAVGRAADVPEDIMMQVDQSRVPRFSDFISIDGVPNVFKFQIFAFSIVAGLYALAVVFRDGTFPIFSTEVLELMGISGGAYLANEMSHKNEWTSISANLELLEEAMQDMSKRVMIDENDVRNKIVSALNGIYGK